MLTTVNVIMFLLSVQCIFDCLIFIYFCPVGAKAMSEQLHVDMILISRVKSFDKENLCKKIEHLATD